MSDLIYWTVTHDEQTPCVSFSQPFEAYLTLNELDRLGLLRFPKRRAEWLHGRWTMKYLLRHSAADYIGLSPVWVQVKNEPEGMPYLEKLPDAKRLPVNISISHRDHHAFCGLTTAPDIQVGVDMEVVENRPPSFLEDYFTAQEYASGLALRGFEQDIWFTLLWSLKESVLKAVGKGLRLDTRNVVINQVEDLTGALHNSDWRRAHVIFEKDEPAQWHLWWRFHGRFIYSIAARFPLNAEDPQLHEVSPELECL
jgi:4'-phosphopantetheinyl transferase